MKIYTGTGDRGKTSLFSGERVSKANLRIDAYGDLDELNSIIGALTASLGPKHPELVDEFQEIQSDLFVIGSLLATTPDSPSMDTLPGITPKKIEMLENAIDRMEATLPELKAFILPGGHPTAAWAHVARTVSRRTERRLVHLLDKFQLGSVPESYKNSLIYLNRLSDFFFVTARYCNHINGVAERLWKK
ncbi:MAG: cob(I)yrinic acid a,c-diamide adenosyltransferase [Deltaproteobacteria bacterium]|nr:cob(I)yrinic acid a,c-diamide adenosyltransferase [Deltaproteobacteria bacterium]